MEKYPNFSEAEFQRCSPACSLSDMDDSFMNRLQTARDLAGLPFRISSAYRSVVYEQKKKRSGTSYHCKGRAVDILCRNTFDRFVIVNALLKAGFTGIGIHSNFIHVDDRVVYTMWLY